MNRAMTIGRIKLIIHASRARVQLILKRNLIKPSHTAIPKIIPMIGKANAMTIKGRIIKSRMKIVNNALGKPDMKSTGVPAILIE